MAPTDAVALVSEDWTPYLIKAPKLIKNLGLCMSMAATREASQIKIPETHGLSHRDLASNLVGVANQGQNAFIEAYGDMLQTASKTNNMGRVGGIVDQISDHFGDKSAERATKRLLDRLQSDVKTCDETGKKTKQDFSNWRGSIQGLYRGLTGAQNQMNEDLSHVEAAQRTGYGNRARLDIDLKQTLQEKAIAERKHENAIQEQAAKEAQLQSFASQAGRAGLVLSFGTIGAAVGVGISSYLSASAAQTVYNAEVALEQQRQLARDMDGKLQNIDIDLKMILVDKKGMDHLLEAVRQVLEMLQGLTDNIIALMSYFEIMNVTINDMVNEHDTQLKSIAADQANGVQLSQADFEDFHKSALLFRKEALTIHALATLYARVIVEVINPGFALIVEFSRHAEGETAMVLAGKQDGLQEYMQAAEQTCRGSALAANRALCDRMDELEQTQSKRKVPKAMQIRDRPEPEGGRRIFGRFNPFNR